DEAAEEGGLHAQEDRQADGPLAADDADLDPLGPPFRRADDGDGAAEREVDVVGDAARLAEHRLEGEGGDFQAREKTGVLARREGGEQEVVRRDAAGRPGHRATPSAEGEVRAARAASARPPWPPRKVYR